MLETFYPGDYLDSTYDIDFEGYYEKGYRGIIFDIDNTLVPHGAPADKRGPRLVNLVSGVIFALGLILTSMLPEDMPWLIYITYGVLAGIGVGLAYAGATNCLQKWFPTKRGFFISARI